MVNGVKHCSQKCYHEATETIKWPLDLPELVNKSSKRAVAASLGVSDKAVAKRLRNHHNQKPVTGVEPAMGNPPHYKCGALPLCDTGPGNLNCQ